MLLDTPDVAGYIRRTGAELGFFATEPYTRRHPREPQAGGPAAAHRPGDLRGTRASGWRQRVPELQDKIDFVPSIEDQINDLTGVASPIEVKVFGPDLAVLRKLAGQVGKTS